MERRKGYIAACLSPNERIVYRFDGFGASPRCKEEDAIYSHFLGAPDWEPGEGLEDKTQVMLIYDANK